ncbi:MAG: hydroxyphenylacetyl-CoA thioesterase PaaI [Candidatus Velthaea sp.]
MQTELAGDPLARACAEAMHARDRAAQALGIALEEAREGYARGLMTITESMINGHDSVHGGVTFTFADTVFAWACNSRNVPHVALSVTMSFTAPGKLGETLRAEAREITLKGRTGVYDITVTNASSGTVIGLFRGTCYRIRGTVLLEGA